MADPSPPILLRRGALPPGPQSAQGSNSAIVESPTGSRILLLGPARTAVSGVSTHINQLFGSPLATRFELTQFQVGSEGRMEGPVRTALRLITSPVTFAVCLIRLRPRIVHINTSFEPKGYWRDLAYLVLARLMRRRIVYQIHGGALPGEFFSGNATLTSLLRRVLSWPDAVVLLAASEVAAYGAFAPGARLIRIANAIQLYDADVSVTRYAGTRPLEVVYVGRLAVNKGILDIIEAVRILRDKDIEVRLTIAGSGAARQEIIQAVASGGLGDRVRVVGAVFGEAKQRLWQQSDVFAFPTYHHEGLPYALLEAMCGGAVPVAAPAGAIPDVMQDGVHGLFVPPRDPQALAAVLERLAGDRTFLHALAAAGRARIMSQYSVGRLAEEFRALYDSLA